VAKKTRMLEVGTDQQKILCYWTKYTILHIIYSFINFPLGCVKTSWGDIPSLVSFCSAFIISTK